MMTEKQIREKIFHLKKQIEVYEEIVNTPSDGKIGRPVGSIKYSNAHIMWLRDNKNMPMTNLIIKFNERFGTNFSVTSRALYNFMCREGILEYEPRGGHGQ